MATLESRSPECLQAVGEQQKDTHQAAGDTQNVTLLASELASFDTLITPDIMGGLRIDGVGPNGQQARYWHSKPDSKRDVPGITRRLQQQEPIALNFSHFCEFVRAGGTWTGALYEPNASGIGWGEFIGQQVFALDFDNTDAQHAPLGPGEPGHITPLQALQRCYDHDLQPVCLYFSFNACPDNIRFRIVLATPELVEVYEDAHGLIMQLLMLFPEADQACKNPNRLFYGSNGEVWECWKLAHPFEEGAGHAA